MLTTYLTWVLISTLVTFVVKILTTIRRQKQLTVGLPEWSLMPFVGNLFLKNTEEYFECILEAARVAEADKEGRFRTWVGTQFFIMTINMEDIKKITNNLIDKPLFYTFARIWIGNGLLTAPSDMWKKNIKILSSTFGSNVVEGFQDIFNVQAKKLIDHLKTQVGGPPFDAFHGFFSRFAFETICQTALGIEADDHSTTEQFDSINAVSEKIVLRCFNVFYHSDFIYKLSADYREVMQHIKKINKYSSDLMIKKRQERRDNRKMGIVEKECMKGKSFLDLLLTISESNPNLTDQQIQWEINTIIFGGQETNAVTLNFLFLCVGSNPRIQNKLFSEINGIFGDSDRDVTREDFVKMPYTEAVINETLRLYPSIPAVMRHADRDLEMDGYTIPKGTGAIVSIWGVGRSKKIWGEDVNEFIPERWIDRELPPNFSFIPFSYGRRACIGKKYSLAVLKTTIAWIVRELSFTSDVAKLKLKSDIALKPCRGHLLNVHLRKQQE